MTELASVREADPVSPSTSAASLSEGADLVLASQCLHAHYIPHDSWLQYDYTLPNCKIARLCLCLGDCCCAHWCHYSQQTVLSVEVVRVRCGVPAAGSQHLGHRRVSPDRAGNSTQPTGKDRQSGTLNGEYSR